MMMTIRQQQKQKTKFLVFFLDGRKADLSLWEEPFQGYFEYERIDAHGNEWYDLIFSGFELWICGIEGKKKKRVNPEMVIEEIKNDFLQDGIRVRLGHKYHNKWLVVWLTYYDDELPSLDNCNYYISDTPDENGDYATCDKPESKYRDDQRTRWVCENYIYLCDEHYDKVIFDEYKGEEQDETVK